MGGAVLQISEDGHRLPESGRSNQEPNWDALKPAEPRFQPRPAND
jgi:hypothetical protein